ncbi:MAG: phenylacetate--CoA ligase family protein [Acidobacteriota bacterium]
MILLADRLDALRSLAPSALDFLDDLRSYQDRRLRRLVRHAWESVPYYRRLFEEHGLDPESVQGIEDLSRIPMSTREDYQQAGPDRLLSRRHRRSRLFQRSTSGSTGKPVTIRCTWFEESLVSALRAKAFWAQGVRPWHRVARVKLALSPRRPPGWVAWLSRLRVPPQAVIDCLLPPGEILQRLEKFRPHVIMSFPEVLAQAAELVRPGAFPRLGLVLVGGETVTPQALDRIRRGLGVAARQGYASHEFGQMAWECPQGLLHVCGEAVLVEVLSDGRPVEEGQAGEVVATALHSLAMPFIRYRLGDLARLGPSRCPCGRPGMTLQEVAGRMADYLVLPDGRLVHPFQVIGSFRDAFTWIAQYQIVQETATRVRVRIRCLQPPDAGRLEWFRKRLVEVLGPEVCIKIEPDAEIAPAPSGKYRVCRSLVWEQRSSASESSARSARSE